MYHVWNINVYIFQNCADVWQNISHKIVAVLGHYSDLVNHEIQHLPCPNSNTMESKGTLIMMLDEKFHRMI